MQVEINDLQIIEMSGKLVSQDIHSPISDAVIETFIKKEYFIATIAYCTGRREMNMGLKGTMKGIPQGILKKIILEFE